MDVSLVRPEGPGAWPPIILYMDAFGIREALLGMAERLAAEGFVVGVPNLYFRHGPFPPFDAAHVAQGGPERDRFKGMIASIDQAMVMADTDVLLRYLDGEPTVRHGAVGVVGYCMGGGFALGAAGTFPAKVAVVAIFHAGSLATDRPDSPHLLAPQMRAEVYVGAAAIDPSFSDEQRHRLEAALSAAGVPYTLEVYDGVKHGFAVTGHLVYDEQASERHWATLVGLLNRTLQQG